MQKTKKPVKKTMAAKKRRTRKVRRRTVISPANIEWVDVEKANKATNIEDSGTNAERIISEFRELNLEHKMTVVVAIKKDVADHAEAEFKRRIAETQRIQDFVKQHLSQP